jgi:hypothetical protein
MVENRVHLTEQETNMAGAKKLTKKSPKSKETRPAWINLILALTLVPLVAGVLLIAAWALDWDITGSLENQIYVGILFLLTSFAVSNLVQKRWLLGTGWVLLMLADILFLFWLNPSTQTFAAILGVAGAGMIGFQYFQQIAQGAAQKK